MTSSPPPPPPPSNTLTNSYFFYGTHPLKVPDHLTHSSSAQNISSALNPATHHLSLQYSNGHHSFPSNRELSATKSLNDLVPPPGDKDDANEIFEDAVESFDDANVKPPANRRSSSTKATEQPTLDVLQALKDCDQINQLFFANRLNEALSRAKALESRSLYHSLCHSTIRFLQATMTFNNDDVEAAMQSLKQTSNLAKKYEPYKPWISFSLSGRSAPNEYELHAKLVYAEALLVRAMLTFIQDQGLFGFISGALKIKECHDIFVKLAKQNDPSTFSSTFSYEHFDSGVRMGNGAFNLMISNLPQRVVKYLEFVGFTGDRELGLSELEKSANSEGLRAAFSAVFLLGYHTFLTSVFGNSDGDLDTCHALVSRYLRLHPDSYLFLFFRARLHTLHCQLHEAIKMYEYAMQCQKDWKHLHHIAYWEILCCHALRNDWKQAVAMCRTLLNENNWSKAMYCYLLSIFLFEENRSTANEEILQLCKRVPELKVRLAGKSIPLEKYAMRQCEHFLAQRWLFLPALEFVYLLNGFYILAHDRQRLVETLDTVNGALNELEHRHRNDQFYADSYGSGLLLRGVLLHFLQRYEHAHQAFDEIIRMSKEFDEKSFLAANATLEKGLIYVTLKQKAKATEYLQKSLNDYKDYQLESRLQFRINAAMQTVKRLDSE